MLAKTVFSSAGHLSPLSPFSFFTRVSVVSLFISCVVALLWQTLHFPTLSHLIAGGVYTCQPGQTSNGPWISQTSDNSRSACEARCDQTAFCVAFDFTSTGHKENACRLVRDGLTPRLGHGGGDNRQYCSRGLCNDGLSFSQNREDAYRVHTSLDQHVLNHPPLVKTATTATTTTTTGT